MHCQLNLKVTVMVFFLPVCVGSSILTGSAFAASGTMFNSNWKKMSPSSWPAAKFISATTTSMRQTVKAKFPTGAYTGVASQSQVYLPNNYSPSGTASVTAFGLSNKYVAAVLPQVKMSNGNWQYIEEGDPKIVKMVQSGSRNLIGTRISFSAGGNTFAGTVMAAKPNAMAVKADNAAWFGLTTTSSSSSLTITNLGLTDEGTSDISSVQVLNNGSGLRISGFDPDGKPGTVDFDIVGGTSVSEKPASSQLNGIVLASSGTVYELTGNSADGLNLARINGIAYESGSIVIPD